MTRIGLTATGAAWAMPAAPLGLLAAAPAPGAEKIAAQVAAPLELKQPASARPWQRYKVDSQGSAWPQTDWREFNNLAAGNVSPAVHPATIC